MSGIHMQRYITRYGQRGQRAFRRGAARVPQPLNSGQTASAAGLLRFRCGTYRAREYGPHALDRAEGSCSLVFARRSLSRHWPPRAAATARMAIRRMPPSRSTPSRCPMRPRARPASSRSRSSASAARTPRRCRSVASRSTSSSTLVRPPPASPPRPARTATSTPRTCRAPRSDLHQTASSQYGSGSWKGEVFEDSAAMGTRPAVALDFALDHEPDRLLPGLRLPGHPRARPRWPAPAVHDLVPDASDRVGDDRRGRVPAVSR